MFPFYAFALVSGDIVERRQPRASEGNYRGNTCVNNASAFAQAAARNGSAEQPLRLWRGGCGFE